MFDTVATTIQETLTHLEPDELAFLALTSKVELPFRDRLAFRLSRAALVRSSRIAREYRRTDLAWLTDGVPRLLLELKACYTGDLINQPDTYFRHVRSDLAKAATIGGPRCARFAILVAIHPRAEVPRPLYDTIKYAPMINRALKQEGGPSAVRERALAEVQRRLRGFGRTSAFARELGEYLGIQVELFAWLMEPRRRPAA